MLKPPNPVANRNDRFNRRNSLKQEDKENSVKKEITTSKVVSGADNLTSVSSKETDSQIVSEQGKLIEILNKLI